MRLRIIAVQGEVLVFVAIDPRSTTQDLQPWKRPGRARQLGARLLEMVQVEVAIAAGPDELARLQPALLREQVGEQRVARDIERHAEEDVRRALVELQREPPVRDV